MPFDITTPPRKLYVRLSDFDIAFARYASNTENSFEFVPYQAQPEASLTVNLREAFRTDPSLREACEAEVLVSGPVTLVPLDVFQEEDCETYFQYCFPDTKGKRIFYDSLPQGNDALLLFGFSGQTCKILEETFENVHYMSTQTSVIAHFARKGEEKAARRLFVYAHHDVADLYVFAQRKLLLCNTYPVHAATDAVYFCLTLARNMQVDLKTDSFYVAGPAPQRTDITAELKKYAQNVFQLNPSVEFNRHTATRNTEVPYDMLTYMLTDNH